MDKANENRNTMFIAVGRFFIDEAGKIQGVQALVRKVSDFHRLCTDIDAKLKELLTNSSGKTDEKDAAEDAMLDGVATICRPAKSSAVFELMAT